MMWLIVNYSQRTGRHHLPKFVTFFSAINYLAHAHRCGTISKFSLFDLRVKFVLVHFICTVSAENLSLGFLTSRSDTNWAVQT